MDKAYWIDEQESGPPTIEDDAWYQHHVVSRGYPKVKREPEQLPGQQTFDDPAQYEYPDDGRHRGKHNYIVVYEDQHERILECSCGSRVIEGG